MRALLLSLIFIFPFFSNSSVAAERQKVVIASFPFPPLLHLAEDGSFSGKLGETVKFICEEANLDCEFRISPLKRSYAELRTGKVDALITLDLSQFSECCLPSHWFSPWSAGIFSKGAYEDIPITPSQIMGDHLIVVNGMKSPYSFIPDLDDLAQTGDLHVYKAQNIEASVRMFINDRAGFLWGGEDFSWYMKKMAPQLNYTYKALFSKNVVLWIRKENNSFLDKFNKAYQHTIMNKLISNDGILISKLMAKRYKDAPFTPKKKY